ncbi:methionine--tRNA ligase [Candidatus Woesearchaeota archaeon]|nr:methionine--tRNA ligase [Candidatus Woesearchaeota archaeon]
MKTFYITTAIDYVNAKPHIGHAYEKVTADIIARWHRLKGEDVFFLTGTDDNAQKNAQAAKEANLPTMEFVDKNAKNFKEMCDIFNISYNCFIRTTEKRHIKVAQDLFSKAFKSKNIYKGFYEGYYCLGCESFKTEKELVEGKCPEHNKEPELRKEETYFFKLGKYKNKIITLVSSKDFIIPKERKNEILSRLKSEDLNDLSVSRQKSEWGITTPIDKNHTIYVWYDALINYISALDPPKGKNFKKYWPADIHLIGKGINWFHSVIWPAILFSASIKQPKQVVVHGYLTMNGQKISKSLGNVIDPVELAKKYSVDSIRYVFIKDIPFGQDGDFSEESLKARHNNELANDLGNLVSRVLTLTEKNFPKGLKKSPLDKKLTSKLNIKKIDFHMQKLELQQALNEIWKFINECNKHINDEKPWELKGKELEKHLYTLTESVRIIAILISPFIPETSEKIFNQLEQKKGTLKDAVFGKVKIYKVKKGEILFKKIEMKEKTIQPEKIEQNLDKVDIEYFKKIDLRVAKIKAVSDHPNAEKLYLLVLNLGKGEHELQVLSGLKGDYTKEDLLGKKVVVIRNLKHVVIRGVESQGMLLAAVFKNKVSLIEPDSDIEVGAKVM